MERDEVWAAYADQKTRVVELLEQLSPSEWNRPTLCEQWTVRDLAGHLTMQGMTIGDAVRTMVREPAVRKASLGGMNRIICEMAKVRARVPIEGLLDQIRATIATPRANPGLTEREALVDIVLHSQDLALPLGRELAVRPQIAAIAADNVLSYAGSWKGTVFGDLGARGYRLVATDIDWSRGAGPMIEGPIVGLLLLIGGRPAGLDQLTGPGVTALRRR